MTGMDATVGEGVGKGVVDSGVGPCAGAGVGEGVAVGGRVVDVGSRVGVGLGLTVAVASAPQATARITKIAAVTQTK